MRKASNDRVLLRSLLLLTTVSAGASVHAQNVVQQAGANPVIINQTATTDVITYLTGGSSEHLDSTGVDSIGRPKYLWLDGFDQTNEYLKWNVSLNTAARYQLTAMIASGAANQTFNVLVDGQQASSGTSTTNDWERLSLGTVSLPAGTHSITIKRAAAGPAAQVKTLELLRESDASALASRVAAFRTDTSKWNSYDYGIMFQYGPWGYPQHGPKKSIDQQAADFDVPKFVSMIKSTGAKYVLWSISWWTFTFDAPSSVVDNVVGNGDRTSSRDLIGDVAAALKKEGIGFYLYYHSGQDEHLGYNVTDWWIKQQWPDGFTNTGTGDRSLFFKNWTDVVTDLGQRYGSNLDGWFFDDGLIYYPGPFEALSSAARAGNSKRLVSFNSWLNPLYSDFQDVSFGEICKRNGAPVGGNGRYTTGSEKGVAGHCQEQFDGDWGIHNPDQGAADPVYTPTTLFNTISYRVRQKVPTSLNLLMWEDGTVAANSLAVLQGAKSLFDDAKGCAFGCARYNNDSPVISYTGAWSTSSNRVPGDYKSDVSATRNNGDSATISFTGSAVRLFAPKNDDYGDFEVILDGTSKGTFSAYNASGYVPRQIVYSTSGLSYGNHTLKIVKRSGNWMQIDNVDVDQSITRINDNDSAITKSGSWNYSANRLHADDYRRDVSYTNNDGDTFSYTFTGTGVQVMMPRDPGQGDVEFFLDGVSKGQVNTRAFGGQYYPEGVMFSVKDLPAGQHTVSAKKLNGSYMQLDAIETTGN